MEGELEPWYRALERPGVRATMCLSLGPIRSEASERRRTVAALKQRELQVVAVTDNRFNRGLVRVFAYLGVPINLYAWCDLDEASRSVASKPRYIGDISAAALELCADAQGQAAVSGILRS